MKCHYCTVSNIIEVLFAGHKVEFMLFESTTELLVQRRISVEVLRPQQKEVRRTSAFHHLAL